MIETKNNYPTTFTKDRIELASKLAADRIVKNKNNNLGSYKYGTLGYFYSIKNKCDIKFRSLYEKKGYELLEKDDFVKSYISEPFRIEYKIDGIIRNYVPDILVTCNDNTKILVEIKPLSKLLTKETILKKFYAKKYCRTNNINRYEIWTETVLFPNRNWEINNND